MPDLSFNYNFDVDITGTITYYFFNIPSDNLIEILGNIGVA